MLEVIIKERGELLRALKLKIAVEVVFDDYGDTRCVLFFIQLSQIQASFLRWFVYIRESLRAVALIVAQSIELFYLSR